MTDKRSPRRLVSQSNSDGSNVMAVSSIKHVVHETRSSQSHHKNTGTTSTQTHGHVLKHGTTKSLPGNLGQEMRVRSGHDHHTANGFVHKHSHSRPPFSATAPRHSGPGRHGHIIHSGSGHHTPRGHMVHSGSSHHTPRGHIVHPPSQFNRPQHKEHAISFFDIELQKTERFQYRPGEEVCGCIHMDVRTSVEVRYLELVCTGEGKATLQRNREGLPHQQIETYLHKQTYVIGTGDARWTSVLTPGHYVSNFRVKLPKTLPSSLAFRDSHTGFMFEISYSLKARLCDDIGSSSIRSTCSNTTNLVKVLLCKKQTFYVQRPFDLHQIPNALIPVMHEEEIILSCANNNTAFFTLSLDRAVFLAGDDIRLQLTSQLPCSQRIKDMTCTLKQNVVLKEIKEKETFILTQLTRKDPDSGDRGGEPSSFEMTIPTQTHLLTSFLWGCKSVHVTYTLQVQLKLSPGGGKVLFAIPIAMGPSAEPIYAEKTASKKIVPVFNRPMRFPCFSPSKPEAKHASSVDQTSRSSQSINVVTKYSNSAMGQCLMCCLGAATDAD